MNRRCFFGTLAGAIVAQPVVAGLAETMPPIHLTPLGAGAWRNVYIHPVISASQAAAISKAVLQRLADTVG